MPNFLRKLHATIPGAFNLARLGSIFAREGCTAACCTPCCRNRNPLLVNCRYNETDPDTCCQCGRKYTVTARIRLTHTISVASPVLVLIQDPNGGSHLEFRQLSRTVTYELDHTYRVECDSDGRFATTCLSLEGHLRVHLFQGDVNVSHDGNCAVPNEFGYTQPAGSNQRGVCPPDPNGIIADCVRVTGAWVSLYPLLYPTCNGSQTFPDDAAPEIGRIGSSGQSSTWTASQTCSRALYHGTRDLAIVAWTSTTSGPQVVGSYTVEIDGDILINVEEPCPTDPCQPGETGACCGVFPVLLGFTNCIVTTPADCASRGGTYAGSGVQCAGAHCEPIGACCAPDGTCRVVRRGSCPIGSRFLGANTSCPQGGHTCGSVGGCCFPDQSCSIYTQAGCQARGGVYLGDGTNCGGSPCVPHGACCIDPGTPQQQCFDNDTETVCNSRGVGGFHSISFTPNQTCADVGCAGPLPLIGGRPIGAEDFI